MGDTFLAFVYLFSGLLYTFFGAKHLHLFNFFLFIFGVFQYTLTQFSLTISICITLIYLGIAVCCANQENVQCGILYCGIGLFVGQAYWVLLASYYAPLWTLGIFKAAIGFACMIYGFTSYDEWKMPEGTALFGANLVALSISLFTQEGLGNFGYLGVQIACCVVLGIVGYKY